MRYIIKSDNIAFVHQEELFSKIIDKIKLDRDAK